MLNWSAMNRQATTDEMVSIVAVLADDVRRRLYFHVRAATAPVTRDGAAAAVGISRKLAAFHLEKLVDEGLVRVMLDQPRARLARPGRSPKLYGTSDAEISLNIPARQYDLMAKILLAAVRVGGDSSEAVVTAATERGREIGRGVRGILRPGKLGLERALRLTMQALTETGYEPEVVTTTTNTEILLRNCPFYRLLDEDKLLVCSLNCTLVGGIVAGLETDLFEAELIPRERHCCVTLRSQSPILTANVTFSEAVSSAAAALREPAEARSDPDEVVGE